MKSQTQHIDPLLDNWKTNWETSYLSATTDTPSKFRIAGETPETNRLFSVSPGLEYEFTYTQSENASVNFFIEASDNGTTWQNIVSSSSSNGLQTVNFTPSASLLKVSFEASGSFKLQDISLNGELYDTLITMESLGGTAYRYGFGGQEKDNEIYGTGNSYTAEFWQYDPRLGRRWNIDPMSFKYPWQSPYVAFNNNPIFYNDPLGLEGEDPQDGDTRVENGRNEVYAGGSWGYDASGNEDMNAYGESRNNIKQIENSIVVGDRLARENYESPTYYYYKKEPVLYTPLDFIPDIQHNEFVDIDPTEENNQAHIDGTRYGYPDKTIYSTKKYYSNLYSPQSWITEYVYRIKLDTTRGFIIHKGDTIHYLRVVRKTYETGKPTKKDTLVPFTISFEKL